VHSQSKHHFVIESVLSRRVILGLLPLLAAAGKAHGTADDSDWPKRTVRFIVSAAAGSAGDTVCRMLALKLGERLGQQFAIDNRPAAGGTLAAEDLSRSVPDGYTIGMISTSTHVIARLFNPNLPYDEVKDFVPITVIGSSPYVLAVTPDLPAKTVADLVALAKTKPRSLSNAAFGTTSLGYLASVLFARQTGVALNQVSYRSSAQAVLDVVAGRVEMQFSTLPPAVPLIRDGKLRALATTGAQRVSTLPEVPTLIEAGLPGYDVALWLGIAAPAGTSPRVIAKLNRELTAILDSAEAREALAQQGFSAEPGPPDQLVRRIDSDLRKWHEIAATAGIEAQ
jgi:tripartite-type tricarboxylate transporter receptor subunit TctC